MEAEAIDRISALSDNIAGLVNEQTGARALYLPPGAKLESTERFAEKPNHQRHHYTTGRIDDFVAYVEQAAANSVPDASPTVYIRDNGGGALAVIDHGTASAPQWGLHTATLTLQMEPAWTAAQAMTTGTYSQTQMIEWLEDWATHITAHAQDGAEIAHSKAVSALRRVKLEAKVSSINEEGDFARNRTALESIEASGDTDALPAYCVLHSPIYIGTIEQHAVLRISVREKDGKPGLALRIVGHENMIDVTRTWVEKTLREKLGASVSGVFVGDLSINA